MLKLIPAMPLSLFCGVVMLALRGIARAQATANTHTFERAALEVTLDEAFVVEAALEEQLPDHAAYVFADAARHRTLAVEVHSYLDASQQAEWEVGGEIALQRMEHLQEVEAIDPEDYPLRAGSGFRFSFADGIGEGVTLFGCDDRRCYLVTVTGPTGELESHGDVYGGMLAGIRFLD